MKTITKIIGIVAVTATLLGATVACTPKIIEPIEPEPTVDYITTINNLNTQITQLTEQLQDQTQTQEQIEELQEQLTQLTEQKERDEQVIQDYQEELNKTISVETPIIQIASYTIHNIKLGGNVTNTTLTTTKLASLMEGTFIWDNEDIMYRQKIILNDDIKVWTSLYDDEEFKDQPYLAFDGTNCIQYVFEIRDKLNYTMISENKPLVINFGGQEYNIIELKAGEFTYVKGNKYSMLENEIITANEKEIKVISIGDGKVVLKIDGESAIFKEKETKTLAGLSIRVDEVFYTGKESQSSMIELTVSDVRAEINVLDGSEFIKDNKNFVWRITTTGDYLNSISVVLDEKINDLDEGMVTLGESFDFAGLFSIDFNYESSYDFKEFVIDFKSIQVNNTDIDTVRFTAPGRDLLVVDEEVKVAYFNGTTVFFKNNNNDWVLKNSLKLVNNEVIYDVGMTGTNLTVGNIVFDLQAGMKWFGVDKKDSELMDASVGGLGLGKSEFDVLLLDGTVIKTPEKRLAKDEFTLLLPDEVVEVELLIK